MNIMLMSVVGLVGKASDMDANLAALFRWLSALIALADGRLCRATLLRLGARRACEGGGSTWTCRSRSPSCWRPAMSLYQTMRGNEQVYFDAAVSLLFFLLVGRFLDESLRVRARGEAQNLAEPAERDCHGDRG